jgi:DNA polymerase III subunit gamma/tau
MRDAQSMLDQLVAFCGETINEENVLDVFGFTSREKVAALTTKLLSRDTPGALKLIQNEAESGRELSQLLGELIGCLRGLLVAKLDPTADGEGIPEALWKKLMDDADEYAPERILAAIDVFAETEGRMKWATNKRLHFELGMIKSIQTLSEIRITDVISVLTKGADHLSHAAPVPVAPPAQEIPAPVAAPKPAAPSKKPGDALSAFDAFIECAPEGEEAFPPAPAAAKSEAPAPAPKAEEPAQEDTFYKDPLIQAALVKFEADFVKN